MLYKPILTKKNYLACPSLAVDLIKLRWVVVQTPPDKDKFPGLTENWSHNILAGSLQVSGNNQFRKWTPLTPVSSWHTPSFLLFTSSLASNRLSPDMRLISTPPLCQYGGEWVQSYPQISSCTRLLSLQCQQPHPPPDLPLTPKSYIDCLHRSPKINLLININFDVNPVMVRPHKFFDVLSVFLCTTIFDP